MRRYRAARDAWTTPSLDTRAHDITGPRYRDAQELHPFNRAGTHPVPEEAFVHELYTQAVDYGYNLVSTENTAEMSGRCWKCGHSSSTTSRVPLLFSGVPTSEQSTPVMSDATRLSKIVQLKGEEVTLKRRRKKKKKKKDDETS